MEKGIEAGQAIDSSEGENKLPTSEALINASGHRQELERNFHLINIAGLGITSGNTWIAIGGSIVSVPE
jgi:choline transport protein